VRGRRDNNRRFAVSGSGAPCALTAPPTVALSGLTLRSTLLSSRAPLTECFLTLRHLGYKLAGYELD
jgi:hypothetical protein